MLGFIDLVDHMLVKLIIERHYGLDFREFCGSQSIHLTNAVP